MLRGRQMLRGWGGHPIRSPGMKTRILLVRHGATVFSAEDRFAGSSDIDLSEEGRTLAEKLAQRLADVKIDAAYCSDMKRTLETCRIVAAPHGLAPAAV